MGTRGLLGHIIRGRKKAAYNHFDSYPAGLGKELVAFITSLSDEQIAEMKKMVEQLEWVNGQDLVPEEVQERYVALAFSDIRVGSQRADDWYCLLHNVQGAKCLPHILDGSLKHQVDSTDFESDGLFCEWVYFIDWEKRELQVRNEYVDEVCSFAELDEGWMDRVESRWREEQE